MDNSRNFYVLLRVQSDGATDVIDVGRPTSADETMPTALAKTAPAASAPEIHATVRCAFCGTPHSLRAAERPDALCSTCRSPLHAVTLPDEPGGPTAGRDVERFDRSMPVQLEVSWPHRLPLAATSEDFSIHGMGLLVAAKLAIGTRVKITCEFCDAVGEVIRVEPRTKTLWRTGVRFLTITVHRVRGGLLSIKG